MVLVLVGFLWTSINIYSTSINLHPNPYKIGPIGLWYICFNMPYRLFGHGVCNTSKINDHVFAYVGPLGSYQELKLYYFHPASPFGNISLSLSLAIFRWKRPVLRARKEIMAPGVMFRNNIKNHTPVTHCSGLRSSRSLQVTSFVFFGFFDIHDSAEEAGQIVPEARTQTLEGETQPNHGGFGGLDVFFFTTKSVAPRQLWRSSFRSSSRTSPVRGFKDLTRWKRS